MEALKIKAGKGSVCPYTNDSGLVRVTEVDVFMQSRRFGRCMNVVSCTPQVATEPRAHWDVRDMRERDALPARLRPLPEGRAEGHQDHTQT
jgi:hypothetical protein